MVAHLRSERKGLTMKKLTLEDLNATSKLGGPNSLTERTELIPAGGKDSIISPAKYAGPTYVFETRFVDDEPKRTVLIDSKNSQANRLESVITGAIRDDSGTLGKLPHIVVDYADAVGKSEFFDTELPHRAFDAHVRIGAVEDKTRYMEARNSSLDNLRPLFDLSPDTVFFGGWDSTRNKNQLRIPSVFVGEIFGVLADQGNDDNNIVRRSGARVDPVAASVTFDKAARKEIVDDSLDLSDKVAKSFEKDGKGSTIVVGAIPPTTDRDALDGVATSKIVRIHVLSFAILRSFRFGGGEEGDVAIRALIAAALLRAMAGSNAELNLRANCILDEAAEPSTVLDGRFGKKEDLEPLSVESAEELLAQAYEQAHRIAGVNWDGQVFHVQGNPTLFASGSDEVAGE